MKKISLLSILIVLFIIFSSCSSNSVKESAQEPLDNNVTQAPTQKPTPSPTLSPTSIPIVYEKPLDLFNDYYNIFSDIKFLNQYTPYNVDIYLEKSYGFYNLSLLAADKEENVISFVASLFDIKSEDLGKLEEGILDITGEYNDEDLHITIEKTQKDAVVYEYTEGYIVTLSMQLPNNLFLECKEILKKNINTNAFKYVNAENFCDKFKLSNKCTLFMLKGFKNYMQINFEYELEDDFDEWKNYFLSDKFNAQEAVLSWEEEEGRTTMFNYGDLDTRIFPPNINQKSISFFQSIESTDTNIADYIPYQSLIMLGFNKSANYNKDENVYIGIRKKEWEKVNEDDENSIIFMLNNSEYDCFLVKFNVGENIEENIYEVQLFKNNIKAHYNYNPSNDEYTSTEGDMDITELKMNMQEIMNNNSDSILLEPINIFKKYINDTFELAPDELYNLPLE